MGVVDGIGLLGHDHHFDNLDHAGMNFLKKVKHVFTMRLAILFMCAARVREVGTHHLAMTAEEGVKSAQCFEINNV